MVTLYRNVRKMSVGGVYCTLRVQGDGERLYVTVGPAAGARIYTVAPSMTIVYGEERASVVEAESDVTVEFLYTGEKMITVADALVWIDGVTYPEGCDFSWENEASDVEDVNITYSIDKIRTRYHSNLTFTLSCEGDGILRPVELSVIYTAQDGRRETKSCEITDLGDGVYQFSNSLSEVIASEGARMMYRIEAAYYTDSESAQVDGGERFVGFGEVFTPSYIISGGQSTPYDLTVGVPVAGCDVRVRWEALPDAKNFTLSKKTDSGEWTQIYAGAEKEYTDLIESDASSVKYKVSSSGSPAWESETITVRHSNMYIGTASGIRAVAQLYLGRDGMARAISPIISVGKG